MEKALTFSDLCEEFIQFSFDEFPEFASYKGITRGQDDKLDPFTVGLFERRKVFYKEVLEKLCSIDRSRLNKHDQISAEILEYSLKISVNGLKYKAYLRPYNIWEGPDVYFVNYTLHRLNFNTEKNYTDYIARLEAFPKQVSESIELCRIGLEEGIVGHYTIGKTILTRLKAVVDKDIERLPHFEPFLRLTDTDIEEKRRTSLYNMGKEIMQRCVIGAHINLLEFMEKEYVPRLLSTPSIGSIPGPPGQYECYLKYFCDTDLAPQELHRLGRQEVDVLMANIRQVMKKVNFSGDAKAFAKYVEGRQDLYFNDAGDVQPYCKHVIHEVIRPKLHTLFKDFKDVPFRIREIHERMTSRGLYTAPPIDGSKPATLTLWISKDIAKFEMIPLMLHEIVPGHHLQACVIQDNTSLPRFRTIKDDRRYFEAPGRTPMFSAYTEGWGLYCEYLGHELGLYDDPYDEFGYLFCNLTRAARLVADTGIHGLGWGQEELKDYIDEFAPLATQTMTEFPRFVIWPAQASSYTYGFLKVKELRERAEKKLGDRFEVREFHQELLECGPVPLLIMEKIIDGYIQRTLYPK